MEMGREVGWKGRGQGRGRSVRQTERQTDTHTHRHTDTQTHRQTPHSADISGIELNRALTFSQGLFSALQGNTCCNTHVYIVS